MKAVFIAAILMFAFFVLYGLVSFKGVERDYDSLPYVRTMIRY